MSQNTQNMALSAVSGFTPAFIGGEISIQFHIPMLSFHHAFQPVSFLVIGAAAISSVLLKKVMAPPNSETNHTAGVVGILAGWTLAAVITVTSPNGYDAAPCQLSQNPQSLPQTLSEAHDPIRTRHASYTKSAFLVQHL